MKAPKNLLLIFLTTWLLSSCFPNIDDTKIICSQDCTTFSGTVKTVDDKGISGVDVSLVYKKSASPGIGLGSYRRKIAKVKTDNDGYYRINAYIKDKELGDSIPGYFILSLNTKQISQKVSDEYLEPNEMFVDGNARVVFYKIMDRSFTFENSFVVPKKGIFKIKLHNFNPIIEDDYFKVSVDYSYTFLSQGWGGIYPWEGVKAFAIKGTNPTEIELASVIGDSTRVIIRKEKNGIPEREIKYIELKNSSPYRMEFDY